jgi:hypothetical protein
MERPASNGDGDGGWVVYVCIVCIVYLCRAAYLSPGSRGLWLWLTLFRC